MAFLIPENIRSNPSVPVTRRNVAAALTIGLDDGATVWYEPPFDPSNDRPHFVVLDPDWGIVVVMVYEDGDDWANDGRSWASVAAFGTRITAAIDARPALRRVTVTGFVAFPTLSRDAAESLGLDNSVDLDRCLFAEQFTAIKRGDDELLPRHLRTITEGGVGETLDDSELDELRGIIHPEIVIGAAPTQPALLVEPTEDVTKVMDRRQERLAKGLGAGHRVIRGVAGSGKTLVLLSRARLLATLMPSQRILVTCFNKSLASSLAAQLADLSNVEVRHIHSIIGQLLRNAGRGDLLRGSVDWESLAGVAVGVASADRPVPYRAVLIDEAQDFDSDMLRLCTLLFDSNDPAEQDLIVVADLAQNLYRRSFTWKSAGIQALGRSTVMQINYRNTRQILEFAHDVLATAPDVVFDDNNGDDLGLVPPETAERSGPQPELVLVRSTDEQIDAVVRQVEAWLDDHTPPRSIAILLASQTNDQLGRRLEGRLARDGMPTYWASKNSDSKDGVGFASEPIVLSTIHSAKGFEFDRVVVAGLPATDAATQVDSYRTAYVAMTRAVDQLTVIAPADGPLTPALVAAHDRG